MNTTIIIIAIVAIAIAVVAYNLGKNAESDAKAVRCKEILNLPSFPGTIKVPHHYLTRYVRMDKEDMHSTNDAIEVLEDDGFTVDDYDADDGIITMTKGIYEPAPLPTSAKVFIVVEVFTEQLADRIIGCFATQE